MKYLIGVVLFGWFLAYDTLAQTFTSSNLPIVVITTDGGTAIPDEPKISATLDIIDNGSGVRNNLTDMKAYTGKMGIELRGSSSQSFPKKQYGIELRDASGIQLDTPILGMPKEHDWVLFGPYDDKSLMRDAMAYKLGSDLNRYASRTKYCEVVINNEYLGVYMFMEKVKRDKHRVDINKLNPEEIDGENVTGGYILKIDKTTGNPGDGFVSAYRPPNWDPNVGQVIYFQYDYPSAANLAFQQKQYIQNYVNAFETNLKGSNFNDPVNGYASYIDVLSFVDFLIMQEVSKNVDGYRLSTYFHKKKDSDGGKLYMGPIWDFNLGFGNADYCYGGPPEGFAFDFNNVCNGDWWLIPFWWSRLMEDVTFKTRLSNRWIQFRSDKFQTATIHERIDSIANLLSESQVRNFQKWPVLGQYVWPNYFVGQTYQEEVDWLKAWIDQRMTWLDENFPKYEVTGIAEAPEVSINFSSYPNPFDADLHIDCNVKQSGLLQVEIQNVLGQSVYHSNHAFQNTGLQQLLLNEATLTSGTYILRIQYNNSFVRAEKIVKM